MNKPLNPLVALLIVAVFATVLGAIFYLDNQVRELPRLTLLAQHPDGDIAVMLGNRLYKLNTEGQTESVIELSEFGVSATVGGFAFFSNGDLLLVADELAQPLVDKLEVYARQANEKYSQTGKNRLLRCDGITQRCELFSADLPAFDRSFRLYIDWQDDTVYLADTSHHRLILVDNSGNQLAIKSGFKFPNQLRFIDGNLWLADTNHHQVVRVAVDREDFGAVLEKHQTVSGSRRFPLDIIKAGKQWWVLIADHALENAVVKRLDQNWQALDRLELPSNADVMSLLAVGDRVLLVDYRKFVLYHYSIGGERLVDIPYPRLNSALAELRMRYFKGKLVVYSSWLLFALLLAVGFFVGYRQSAQVSYILPKAELNTRADIEPIPAKGIWLSPLKSYRAVVYVFSILQVMAWLSLGWVYYRFADSSKDGLMVILIVMVVMLGSMALIQVPLWRYTKFRLGLMPEFLVFVDHRGDSFEQAYAHLDWTRGLFRIGDYVVPYPFQGRGWLFPAAPLKRYFLPRLNPAKQLNSWVMMRLQWNSPDQLLKTISAMLLALLVAIAGIEIYELFR